MQESVSTVNAWSRNRYGLRETRQHELIFESTKFLRRLVPGSWDREVEEPQRRQMVAEAAAPLPKEWLVPYRAKDYKRVGE